MFSGRGDRFGITPCEVPLEDTSLGSDHHL